MKFWQALSLTFALSFLMTGAARAKVLRAAIFDFSLDDTSLQAQMSGLSAGDLSRLNHLNAQLRTLLTESGRYQPVDMAPVEAEARASNLDACGGCAITMASKVGAQVAVTGLVQKVSNLILNINVTITDVATGQVLAAQSVDIRGDTDESWTRGLNFLFFEMKRRQEAKAAQ
jgi:Protein of unknown function (DUF2380)